MNFRVFDWEIFFIEVVRSWPKSGPLYEFLDMLSDFSFTIWIILLVLGMLVYLNGWRRYVAPIGVSVFAATFADLISHRLIQALIRRSRPNFYSQACDTCKCWGFVSSHATNVFAILVVLYCWNKKTLYWTLPLALLISFSRVYLVSHYPFDVIGGAVTGSFIGYATVSLYNVIKEFFPVKLAAPTLSGRPPK